MITRLKEHKRVDRFLNDVRANQKAHRNYGRYFYVAALLGGVVYLGNLFGGHLLWLRAEGLILADHVIIASPYAVQITKSEKPWDGVTGLVDDKQSILDGLFLKKNGVRSVAISQQFHAQHLPDWCFAIETPEAKS